MKDTKIQNTNEERKIIGRVVDEYGEIIDEVYEGDKIVHPKDKKKDSEAKLTFKPEGKGLFGKLYLMPLRTLYNELSYREMATLTVLVTFASYQDCILKVNHKYADAKDLSKELNENYDSFRKVITSLIKKGILQKVERQSDTYQNVTKQCLVLNPYICFRGITVNRDVKDMFSKTKWAHISELYVDENYYEDE